MRWVGATVATLVAGDDVLKPRAVILADEQLTGPARDKVTARIDRFVAYHIETVLKPLTDLGAADALTGMTRGLAFQIVENLGILQRRDVAEEVRGLDQDSRAALRRLGVRFGAYHVFMPMLLKPAPAGLITLLWALKNDGRERAGYGDVVNVLAAGRTSVVVDPTFDQMFYRLAGYRVLGRRAVRIDILERLADLIRPALAWRPGSGTRPDGAYDGGRFIVTPAMMSILGATAEDMEEVLKSLGYRHEAMEAAAVTAKLAELDAFAAEAAARKPVPLRQQNRKSRLFPTRNPCLRLSLPSRWKRRWKKPLPQRMRPHLPVKPVKLSLKSPSRFFSGGRAVSRAAIAIRTRIASVAATRIAVITTATRPAKSNRRVTIAVAAASASTSTSAITTVKASAKAPRANSVAASASRSAIMVIRATSALSRNVPHASTPIRLSPSFWL